MENLLKDLLNLDTREDFREYNKGNIIALDLNKSCDLAFVRCRFRRSLKGNTGLILINSKNNKTILDFNNSYNNSLDFTILEDCNKVLKSIENWINNIKAEGLAPQKIAFK